MHISILRFPSIQYNNSTAFSNQISCCMQHENWEKKHTFPPSFSDNTLVFNNPVIYTSQNNRQLPLSLHFQIFWIQCMIEHEKLIIFLNHLKQSTNSICYHKMISEDLLLFQFRLFVYLFFCSSFWRSCASYIAKQ